MDQYRVAAVASTGRVVGGAGGGEVGFGWLRLGATSMDGQGTANPCHSETWLDMDDTTARIPRSADIESW